MHYEKIIRCLLPVIILVLTPYSIAEEYKKPFWLIQTSVYTTHFHPKPEHNNHQDLISLDYNWSSQVFLGAATFRNSFRQRSFYAYLGKRYDIESTPLYFKISAGFIHGYRGKYKHKIPLNDLGVAPAIIPSLGIQVNRLNVEAVLLGFNAMMVNIGISID